jgi:hypothetical protein
VEPLDPEYRAALKAAHPGLTDEDIDRTEELLAERMRCDPEREAERIARLDRERQELIRRTMPHYAAVSQAFKSRRAQEQRKAAPSVKVELKKPER